MKKIALNIETLSVESFEAGSAMDLRGTVQGNLGTLNANCYTKENSCHRTPCCPDTTFC